MTSSGQKPIKFPPAPIQTPSADKSTLSGFSKQWIAWFTAIVTQITQQISQILGLSFQPFPSTALPALTNEDAGVLINVTDFNHVLQWNGTAFQWGPGELGSGYIQAFLAAPTSSGWHICDGSTVSRLNSDGTVTAVVLPDYTTAAYLKLGVTQIAGPTPASGETGATDLGTPTGVISDLTFNGTPGTTGFESADISTLATTGAGIAGAQNHTHDFTPAGTIPTPTFTGNGLGSHTHGPGTLELGNSQLQAWFRQ